MSFSLSSRHTNVSQQSRWPGAAFLIESMLLLVFVTISIVVFTQLFVASSARAFESEELANAVAVASNAAERFAADPRNVTQVSAENDLIVTTGVRPERWQGGTLYHATIRVYEISGEGASAAAGAQDATNVAHSSLLAIADSTPVYTLTTAVYESEVRADG